jgi:hypothetical protein
VILSDLIMSEPSSHTVRIIPSVTFLVMHDFEVALSRIGYNVTGCRSVENEGFSFTELTIVKDYAKKIRQVSAQGQA